MLRVAVFLFLLQEYNCYLVSPLNVSRDVNISTRLPANIGERPEVFDWRDTYMVSPIKNQMTCGACWAFSIVAAIESHLKIHNSVEIRLSEQFLIDCEDASKGCNPASLLEVYADIVNKFGGVLSDRDYYPYAEQRRECRWVRPTSGQDFGAAMLSSMINARADVLPVVGFRRVQIMNEESMAEHIYRDGPLSAAINSASMKIYKGGIDEPTDEDCDPKKLDHAVLIVGYNAYESKSGKRTPYWIIKNSWGPNFGDSGFYYLVRGRNACGIASDVSFPYVN